MRRLFTLLFIGITAIAGYATDYNVPITVTINGVTSEQHAVISVNEVDGRYDITLNNFMLQSADANIGVGNVELRGIKPYQDGNATLLIAADQVTITDGNDPAVTTWLASILPPVNVLLRGKIEGEHLRCCLDIDLTESLGQKIEVGIGGGYQLPNQSFESWHTSTGTYTEPNGWHSFESATGTMAMLAGHHIEKSGDAHSGAASARIFASSIIGIIANGTMTTGRMNAGAISATDPANNAYLDMTMTDVDGNGDPYYMPLYSRPDSVAVWVKFAQGTPNSEHPYATISAVITDGTYYQDPEDKEYTNVVAKAGYNQIATTDGQWVRIAAPFVYTDATASPQAILITISTNADPGQGSDKDEVLVDDIQLIYNANVSCLKIKGHDVPDFRADRSTYEMQLDEAVAASDVEAVVNGRATHTVKHVEVTDGYYLCTVSAIGADMSATTSYTVNVKSSAAGIKGIKTATNLTVLYFTLDGRRAEALVPGRIYICHQADGTVTKVCP